jgi:hypothetical protein
MSRWFTPRIPLLVLAFTSVLASGATVERGLA